MLFANNEALQKSLLEGANTLTDRLKQEPDMTKRASNRRSSKPAKT